MIDEKEYGTPLWLSVLPGIIAERKAQEKEEMNDKRKEIHHWFATELAAALPGGVGSICRDIFQDSWGVIWPVVPVPKLQGTVIAWCSTLSPVTWDDRLIDRILDQPGGVDRVKSIVLACRTQSEADHFRLDYEDCERKQRAELARDNEETINRSDEQ